MSESLGEKLRKARESRGMTISQVSEQTRIASHYLISIEGDDFSPLPGGIFNKGFVRSFAKCVGVDEHEALSDYNALMAASEPTKNPDELYTPEVLSSDSGGPSMASTIMLIVLILAVLIGGLIAAIYFVTGGGSTSEEGTGTRAVQTQRATPDATPTPKAESFKVEVSTKEKVFDFGYELDGKKVPVAPLKANETQTFEVKESFRTSVYRGNVSAMELRVNGTVITLGRPTSPLLDIEINRDNLAEILSAGSIGVRPSENAVPDNAPSTPARPIKTPKSSPSAPPAAPAATGPSAAPKPTPSR